MAYQRGRFVYFLGGIALAVSIPGGDWQPAATLRAAGQQAQAEIRGRTQHVPSAAERTTSDLMQPALAADAAPGPLVSVDMSRVLAHRRARSLGRSLPAPSPAAREVAELSSVQPDLTNLAQTLSSPNVDVVTLADTNLVPPDTMGDAGLTQYLVAANGRIRTIDKSSGAADGFLDTQLHTFFDAVRQGHMTTNPRVRYDRRANRWYVLAINLTVPNAILLAVSDGGTITSGTTWTYFSRANDRRAGGAPAGEPCLADFPTLGVDEDALYVGVNQFCGPALGSLAFDSTSGYVINKASVLGSDPALVTAFDALALGTTGAGPYTPQGVDNFDANTNVGYFIGVDNAELDRLQLRRVSNPGSNAPTLSSNIPIPVAATELPINVPHQGGTLPLDAQDDRLNQAVIRAGRLWTNHQIEVDASGLASQGGGRTAIRWYELQDLDTAPAVHQFGTVFDAASANPLSYFMGSVMVSGQGHVALGSTVAGAAAFVNAVTTGRLASDPLGQMNGPPQVFTPNSSATYNAELPPLTSQSWGGYSYTSVDPTDDMTMWTLQQYVNATNSYALRLVRLQAPPPAPIASVSPSIVTPGRAGVAVTVTGSATAGAGYFDPGPGVPNRLTAAFAGSGITVTSAAVVSPTQVMLTVDTTSALVGTHQIAMTNPDGQVASLGNALTVQTNQAPVAVADAYSIIAFGTLTVPAPGVIANDTDPNAEPLVAVLQSGPAHGTLTLNANGSFSYTPAAGYVGADSFTYTASDGLLSSGVATVSLTVSEPTTVQPPSGLLASTVSGNTVTLRWTAPPIGPVPTNYVLEGGVRPGEVLASIPTNNTAPIFTVVAPSGSFYVRMHAMSGAQRSAASNEIRIHVNVPVTPSAPAGLVGLVDGSTLNLAWRNTFGGGTPTSLLLDVTGSAVTTIPLGLSETFGFAGVPSGTYTLRLRAVNAGRVSPPSDPVTLTFPGSCSGVPDPPADVLAYRIGNTAFVVWNPASTGPAPTRYTMNVSGTFVGGFSTTGRALSGTVGRGTYNIEVVASNRCGTSAAGSRQTIVVP